MTSTPFDHKRGEIKNCTVKDLSIGGIRLDIWGRHSIEEGHELLIEFNLNTKKKSLIKCEVTVKTVQNNFIGAKFKEQLDFNPDLGFYLLS